MKTSKRILIVGGTGGVGKHICREVIRQIGQDVLIVGDYKRQRGEEFAKSLGRNVFSRPVDVNDSGIIEKALEHIDAVIVATKQIEPRVQALCVDRSIPCLDITPYADLINKAKALHEKAMSHNTGLVVAAGLFPGLSGIMAKYACESFENADRIDVGMLQNTNAVVGPIGIAAMLGLFAQPVIHHTGDGQQVRPGFTVKRTFDFPEPFGKKTQRLFNYCEALAVAEKCNVENVNYWTGFDKPSFDMLLFMLNKLGVLNLFNSPSIGIKLARIVNSLKGRGSAKPETIAVTVEVGGKRAGKPSSTKLTIVGPSDYGTTAMCVVAMTKLIINESVKARGVRFPLEIFPLHLLLDTINSEDVKLYELAT